MEHNTIVVSEEAKELYSKVELVLSVLPEDANYDLKWDAVDYCVSLVRNGLLRRLNIGPVKVRSEEEDW